MRNEWQWIFWYDWALLPVYILIISLMFKWWGKKHVDEDMKKYFLKGLYLKFIGGMGFAIFHQYIFHGGDTLFYFKSGIDITRFLNTDFVRYISLTFLPTASTTEYHMYILVDNLYGEANFFIIRMVAILAVFTFSTYLPTLVCFTALSYIGIWYCFTTIVKVYPNLKKELAISFLYIPSVILWGSGLGKDSITFGATCLLFGALVRILILPKPKIISNLLFLFISGSILLIVKSYIFYSFILSFTIGIILQKLVLIKNMGLKIILFPLIIFIAIIVTFGVFQYINSDEEFGLDAAAEKVLNTNKYLSIADAGSKYDLGIDVENIKGFTGILPIFPKSIFITLFRPFLWEVTSPSMLLSALESLVIFAIAIYIMFKRKILGIFPILINNPIAFSCLLFTLVFAGFIGITSANFGTLVRYKIPCIPFFCMLLAILNSGSANKKDVDTLEHTT